MQRHRPQEITTLFLLLPLLMGASLISCLAHPQGLGGLSLPATLTGRPKVQLQASLAGGGHTHGGLVQGKLSATLLNRKRWFAFEVGMLANGTGDTRFRSLHRAQGSSFNYGFVPFAAPIFFVGPVHIRLMGSLLGGGGPQGPAGFWGLGGGSVGYHFGRACVYAGGVVYANLGCCKTNFFSHSYQYPLGFSMDFPFGKRKRKLLRLGLEVIYSTVYGKSGDIRDDYHLWTALLRVTFAYGAR